MNKSITTNQFFELYPDIPVRTFWSWVYRGKKVQINGLHQWSKSYKFPVKKEGNKLSIPLKGLAKFFKNTRQNEYYLRVPSYIK